MDNEESLIVNKDKEVTGGWTIDTSKYGSAIVIVILIMVIAAIVYCKDTSGFASPDGVVASKKSRQSVRSDTHVDRTWNLAELEKSVALLNRKAAA